MILFVGVLVTCNKSPSIWGISEGPRFLETIPIASDGEPCMETEFVTIVRSVQMDPLPSFRLPHHSEA